MVLFGLAMAYFFRWGPTVEHLPLWEAPGDLWETIAAANSVDHGHFGAIYAPANSFYAFPGILVLLAPVAALANALGMGADVIPTHIVAYPQAFLLLGPYIVLLSAFALFACDALAERLGVDWRKRAVLALAEGVVLFNVSVFWGHPEYPVAVGLAVYALIAAIDGRFTRAGWLFGAALAFQPLVIVALPILIVVCGRKHSLGLIVRGAIPAAALVLAPLVSNAHVTLHALLDQPFMYPVPVNDHATPWTFLAPKLGGSGTHMTVGGGPMRLVSLLLACAIGWWALRWRDRPEMLVWAFALALALRCYTESVMTDYYLWPALAVGLVVAARGSNLRFAIAIVAAVFTTITAQWYYSWLPWWMLDVGGITVLLAAAAGPAPVPADAAGYTPSFDRSPPEIARPEDGRQSSGAEEGRRGTKEEEQGGACHSERHEEAMTSFTPILLRRLRPGAIMGPL